MSVEAAEALVETLDPLMRAVEGSDESEAAGLVEYTVWKNKVDEARTHIAPLEEALTDIPPAPEPSAEPSALHQRWIVAHGAFQRFTYIFTRVDEALKDFDKRAQWRTELEADEKPRPALTKCPEMSSAEPKDKPKKEMIKRWVRRWKVAQAYRGIHQGTQYGGVAERRGVSLDNPELFIKNLSALNLAALKDGFVVDDPAEKNFLARAGSAQYVLKHATDKAAIILGGQALISLASLKRKAAGKTIKVGEGLDEQEEVRKTELTGKVMTTEQNYLALGYADFVFFRFDIDETRMLKTRYGATTFMVNLSDLKTFGWVSLHDQLLPWDNEDTRKVEHDGEFVRETAPKAVRPHTYWTHKYGRNTDERTVTFDSEIFYGPDIIDGIGYSLLTELRYIAGLGTGAVPADPTEANYEKGRAYRLDCFNKAAADNLRDVLKRLCRVEAKIPVSLRFTFEDSDEFFAPEDKKCEYRRVPLIVSRRYGDGRYKPDGSEHPAGMVAAYYYDNYFKKKKFARTPLSVHRKADLCKRARRACFWHIVWRRLLAGEAQLADMANYDGVGMAVAPALEIDDPRPGNLTADPFSVDAKAQILAVIDEKLILISAEYDGLK